MIDEMVDEMVKYEMVDDDMVDEMRFIITSYYYLIECWF